jgi:hypothetical protein
MIRPEFGAERGTLPGGRYYRRRDLIDVLVPIV